jgi:hypothetical protein
MIDEMMLRTRFRRKHGQSPASVATEQLPTWHFEVERGTMNAR